MDSTKSGADPLQSPEETGGEAVKESSGQSSPKLNKDNSTGQPGSGAQTFEDLLKIVGDSGAWQLRIFLLASFCGFVSAMHNLVYAFVGAIPEHWCQVPAQAFPDHTEEQLRNLLIPRDKDGNLESCSHYGVNGDWDSGSFNLATILKNETQSCSRNFDFDQSTYKSTIATEFNLVCGDEFYASTVQALYMFGSICGSLIFGALSDKLGRRRTILISSIIFSTFAPLVALSPNFTLVMIGRFILGTSQPGIYATSFVIVIEGIGSDWRGLAGNLFCLPFALGYMVLPGIAYFLREWRMLQLAVSAPALLLIVTWFFIPESPRWLLRKGRSEEAEKILRAIAAANGTSQNLPPNFSQLTAQIADQEKEEVKKVSFKKRFYSAIAGYTALLRSPRMRTRTLVLYFSWISCSMVYYGIALNSPNLSTNKYLYTFISGVLEVPSYFMVPPLIRYLGRRPSFSGLLLICGVSLMSSLIFPEGTATVVVLALLGKLLIGAAFALIYLYATEVFPTLLRNYGLGTAAMIGRSGSVLAPYIVDLVGKGNKTYPTIVFGAVSLAAGALALLLPETLNRRLPETIADVEEEYKNKEKVQK